MLYFGASGIMNEFMIIGLNWTRVGLIILPDWKGNCVKRNVVLWCIRNNERIYDYWIELDSSRFDYTPRLAKVYFLRSTSAWILFFAPVPQDGTPTWFLRLRGLSLRFRYSCGESVRKSGQRGAHRFTRILRLLPRLYLTRSTKGQHRKYTVDYCDFFWVSRGGTGFSY